MSRSSKFQKYNTQTSAPERTFIGNVPIQLHNKYLIADSWMDS